MFEFKNKIRDLKKELEKKDKEIDELKFQKKLFQKNT